MQKNPFNEAEISITPSSGVNIRGSKAVRIGDYLFLDFGWEGSVTGTATIATLGVGNPNPNEIYVGTLKKSSGTSYEPCGYKIDGSGNISQISTGSQVTIGTFSAIIKL